MSEMLLSQRQPADSVIKKLSLIKVCEHMVILPYLNSDPLLFNA